MINWREIDTVLLDMDGTLLDLYFDNYFWLEYLPSCYAKQQAMPLDQARDQLMEAFHHHQGTLNWYCLDFWSDQLKLDVVKLKEEVSHLIQPRPHAQTFLKTVRASGRRALLVTNAHRESLNLKLRQTGIHHDLDALYSSHDFGLPKEDPLFWDVLAREARFDEHHTLLIDDSLPVLRSAVRAGIRHTLAVRRPDSKQGDKLTDGFEAIDSFLDLMPVPARSADRPHP
jgi:putative hydrolase of the HAD superfamily